MGELYQDPVNFWNCGERISGLLHIPEEDNPPSVIMCHGWTGNMHSHGLFVECASRLCEAGFAVLRFDFRGSEHSEGRFEDMTVMGEVSDLAAALTFLKKRGYAPSRTGFLGYSLGGLISILGWKSFIGAMALWSTTLKPREVFERIIGSRGLREIAEKGYSLYRKDPSPYRQRLRFKVGRPFFESILKIRPEAKASKVSCPVIIIHGDRDDIVDVSQSRDLFKLLTGPKELTVIEGADHYFNGEAQRERLYSKTVDWFIRWLK
ncbi:MAG: alpha/beta fold hydrolase [Candidatus Bathyarchaeia archaeon]